MIEEKDKLIAWIEHHYGASVRNINDLVIGWKKVYRIEQKDGQDWVMRSYPPPGYDGLPVDVEALAAVLLFLEQKAYPAERIVRAIDQSSVTKQGDWQVLITQFLHGVRQHWSPAVGSVANNAPFEYETEMFYALGAAVGRLHMLQPDSESPFSPAGMLPSRELTWAGSLLASVAGSVPSHLQAEYDHLAAAVQQIDRCENLPFTLIHNDPNLDNLVLTPQGKVILIDWESAGWGPALIDVGILLSNCFSKQQLRIRADAITAIVDGYCQHRRLNEAELERLPDAVRFFRLVLLAGYFPDLVNQKVSAAELLYGATYAQWQAQYEASAEIAALARVHFERYL